MSDILEKYGMSDEQLEHSRSLTAQIVTIVEGKAQTGEDLESPEFLIANPELVKLIDEEADIWDTLVATVFDDENFDYHELNRIIDVMPDNSAKYLLRVYNSFSNS